MALELGTDDKKKLYILGGLLALAAVVGVVVFKPFGRKTSTTTSVSTTTAGNTANTVGAPPSSMPGISGATLASAPGVPGAATASTVTGTTGGGSGRWIAFPGVRRDPFMPHYIPAMKRTPVPPPPPPPPPPPTPRPPLAVPSPGEFFGGADSSNPTPFSNGGLSLPPASILPGTSSAGGGSVMTNLPPISIPQYQPRESPRLTSSAPFASGRGGAEISSARLAGVVIGDSVRALVEITLPNGTTVSRVVQPGDEVEGIRILRLERINTGSETTTRMTVSRNGKEEYFTLRPASGGNRNNPAGGLGFLNNAGPAGNMNP